MAQAVAKTQTHAHNYAHSFFLSPFHFHSCTIMRIHIRIQRPSSCKTNTHNSIPLFVYKHNHSTQNMSTRHANFIHTHTQYNLHPQTQIHTHIFSPPPPPNADGRDLQGSGTKEWVTPSSNHHMVKKPCVSLATQHSQAT